MINVNATLVVQIINFLILIFIINRILFRPIMDIVEKRSAKIKNEEERLKNLEEETRALIEKCSSIEKETRKKAMAQSALLRKEASDQSEEIFNKVKDEINGIREEADKEIQSKIEEASISLQNFASEIAEELTEKVIGRRFAS